MLNMLNLRVLVVDENSDTRDLFATMFKAEGAKVVAVSSASEALKVMKKHKPNILISDIMLPDIDGYTLMKKIRNSQQQEWQQIPAIAVTALDEFNFQPQALKAGFQLYLRKPVDIEELLSAVGNLLTGSVNFA